MQNTFKKLRITFLENIVKVFQYADESNAETYNYVPESPPGYLTALREGRFAIGGLLGEL